MSARKTRVLFVDDEPSILKTVGKYLEVAGFEVLMSMDGQDGISKAQEMKPDVIILDLMLPWVSGFEVCATIKNDPRMKHIPIIIYSGEGKLEEEKRCRELGAAAYVPKEQGAQALIEQIKLVLAPKPSQPTNP